MVVGGGGGLGGGSHTQYHITPVQDLDLRAGAWDWTVTIDIPDVVGLGCVGQVQLVEKIVVEEQFAVVAEQVIFEVEIEIVDFVEAGQKIVAELEFQRLVDFVSVVQKFYSGFGCLRLD